MLYYPFIFIFGLCVGSFLNVLICRLGGRCQIPFQTVPDTISGRSHCPQCGHILGWRDLVPVLSFLLLRGRCRYCREKISGQYPIVEMVTGILFVFIFWYSNNPSLSLPFIRGGLGWGEFSYYWLAAIGYWLFLTSCLIVIFVSDLKYFIIPDEIIIAGIIGVILYKLFGVLDFGHWDLFGIWNLGFGIWRPLLILLFSAIGAGAFFLLIVLVTRGRGMGLGDVKLAFLMGLILGWPAILAAMLLSFISGAIVGLGLIIAGRAKLKSELPFGTFLAASTFLAMVFGSYLGIIDFFNLL